MLWNPFNDPRLPDPFRTIRVLQGGLDQLLATPTTGTTPPITVYSKDDGCLVRALVPGLAPNDIELEVDGDELSIAGHWPDEPDAEVLARHSERPSGRFVRNLRLPFEVDASRVVARMERGVLEIELFRTPEKKAHRIEVQTDSSRSH